MKKSNFLNGAIIATIGIVVCKIIGLLYVIPFYAMIGTSGGALYSYAYSIYAIFLSLSTSGIPVAMSKLVSEYNALEYYNTKERIYKIGSTIIISFGIISFIVIMFFAEDIALFLKGGVTDGTSIESIAAAIRVISTALLVVPSLSVTKGYLQGHKVIKAPATANIIEQLARVAVLLIGSFLALKVFELDVETAVQIAVFAATVGAVVSYGYLVFKIKRSKKDLNKFEEPTKKEMKITTKELVKKIIIYAVPFVLIDLVNSAYVIVNSSTIISTLTKLGYNSHDAEIVLSSVSTWATKLDMIVISVAIGFVTSLIPHITSSYVKKEMDVVNKKINQAIEMLILIVLPMSIGLSFLASPIWTIFYGYNALSISVFKLFAFQALTYSLHWLLINVLQALNKSKVTLMVLFGGLAFKILFNNIIMEFLPTIGIDAHQGATLTTLLVQLTVIIFIIGYLKHKFKIDFSESRKSVGKIIISAVMMTLTLFIVSNFIKLDTDSRTIALMNTVIYATIGAIVYLLSAYKLGLLNKFIRLLKSKKA